MKKKKAKATKAKKVALVEEKPQCALTNFNNECKELVRNQISKLFDPERGLENYNILYNLIYYIAQEAAFLHLPMGQVKHAMEKGSDEALKNQLDWIAEKYNLVGQKEDFIPQPSTDTIN